MTNPNKLTYTDDSPYVHNGYHTWRFNEFSGSVSLWSGDAGKFARAQHIVDAWNAYNPEAVARLVKAVRQTLGHGSWDPSFNELLAALKEIDR